MDGGKSSVVVDASVVLKRVLFDEHYVRQARALRNDFLGRRKVVAIAPQPMAYEVVNGIVSAVRQKRLGTGDAADALDNIMTVPVELVDVAPHRVLELSLAHGLSAYDAAYLALAQTEGCELWTGDKPFYDAMRGAARQARWIGEYPVAG